MKTKINISNLKKLAVTACGILLIATGSYTQPNAEGNVKNKMVSLASLDVIMKLAEQSIKYVAPAIQGTEDVSAEMESLDILASTTGASLKYRAPAADEYEVIAPELEQLEMLAAETEASLKYVAPAINEEDSVFPEIERLEMLAAATEVSLKYVAPAAEDLIRTERTIENSAEKMLADKSSFTMK